jgi:2-amino-4-hydroxy-6-hydroxymethyldihydropteridine diphosphokinase
MFAAAGSEPDNSLMAKVFVGVGSNLGDRAAHVQMARQHLGQVPGTCLMRFSGVYETDPIGPQPQDRYLNAAAELRTTLDPETLLAELIAIEILAGRPPLEQRKKWVPRTLDLDILLFDQRVVSNDRLIVPHPLMHERWFVLRPLADLDPHAVHPLLQMTVAALLRYVEQGDAADGDKRRGGGAENSEEQPRGNRQNGGGVIYGKNPDGQ